MKNKILLSLIAIAIFVGIIGISWTVSAQKTNSGKQTWEYRVLTIHGDKNLPPPDQTQLNQLGTEGWELVAIIPEQFVLGGFQQVRAHYYFKRAK